MLDTQSLEKTKLIIEILKKADQLFGGLKHHNLSEYLDKISQIFLDNDLESGVIIVHGIHPNKLEEIQEMLKDKRFKINTQIRIFFLDGSEYSAQFVRKKQTTV